MDCEFYHALAAALSNTATCGLGPGTPNVGTLGVAKKFLDLIKSVASSLDLSAISKEDFLAAVSKAFDTFIAPMLATSPASAILTPLVKALVMALAAKFYDNRIAPKSAAV